MRDKDAIRRELVGLGLPEIVLQIFDGMVPYQALSIRCEDPHKSLVEGSGFPENLLPLWECGVVVTAYDKVTSTFCRVSLEDPGNPRFHGEDFCAVATDLLVDLWEDEVADEVLAEIATAFGIARFESLVVALEAGPCPSDDYYEWRAALRRRGPHRRS